MQWKIAAFTTRPAVLCGSHVCRVLLLQSHYNNLFVVLNYKEKSILKLGENEAVTFLGWHRLLLDVGFYVLSLSSVLENSQN